MLIGKAQGHKRNKLLTPDNSYRYPSDLSSNIRKSSMDGRASSNSFDISFEVLYVATPMGFAKSWIT